MAQLCGRDSAQKFFSPTDRTLKLCQTLKCSFNFNLNAVKALNASNILNLYVFFLYIKMTFKGMTLIKW